MTALTRISVPLLLLSTIGACAAPTNDEGDPEADLGATSQELSFAVPTLAAPDDLEAAELAVGSLHACAREPSGRVACWGDNASGKLGQGTFGGSSASPSYVGGLDGAREIAAGGDHTCVVRAGDGIVQCWGRNVYSQLGVRFDYARATPVTTTGLGGARLLTLGADHSCAVTGGVASLPRIRCWGRRDGNLLGDGVLSGETEVPTSVSSVSYPAVVAAGHLFSCARGAPGDLHVRCWGRRLTLVPFGSPMWLVGEGHYSYPVEAVVVSLAVGQRHACFVDERGWVHCWGESERGQTGGGTAPVLAPRRVLTGRAVAVAAGANHTCALLETGAVQCWGANLRGQLGNGTTAAWLPPVAVSGLSGVTAIAAGGDTTCASTGGRTYCWGANTHGQLGDGTYVDRSTPVRVRWPLANAPASSE